MTIPLLHFGVQWTDATLDLVAEHAVHQLDDAAASRLAAVVAHWYFSPFLQLQDTSKWLPTNFPSPPGTSTALWIATLTWLRVS